MLSRVYILYMIFSKNIYINISWLTTLKDTFGFEGFQFI